MQARAIQKLTVSRSVRSGAISGALSAFFFAVIHDIFISDIWFSLIIMVAAGALCGLLIGWSYTLLVKVPTSGSWWRYNLLYVVLLYLLGVTSILTFEPTMTMAALIQANEPPGELIAQALPMTGLFTLFSAVLIILLYGRQWRHFTVVLLTCTVLILLLGLNVSVLGLIAIPRGSIYLIVEFFGLILALNVVYAAFFVLFERKHWLGGSKLSSVNQPQPS